jgi:hypothetical protein
MTLISESIVEDSALDWLRGLGYNVLSAEDVCMSRRICVDLYARIAVLRPDWVAGGEEDAMLKIVMTGSAADPAGWQRHIRTPARREKLAERFRDPADRFRLVIVRDMWLTGFDAPSLHTKKHEICSGFFHGRGGRPLARLRARDAGRRGARDPRRGRLLPGAQGGAREGRFGAQRPPRCRARNPADRLARGEPALQGLARELVRAVRNNVTLDWKVRESVRAQLRVIVKRILRKHGYPPDKQARATQVVLEQAEVLSEGWALG